jgi:3-hydroxyisobutyrate dehydrogenase
MVERMDVGFCGLGDMGSAMVSRLLDRGHRVSVWNRTEAKAEPLLRRGAIWAANPAELAQRHAIVISCLFDGTAVTEVYAAPNGLLAAECGDKLFIDLSTVDAPAIIEVACRTRATGAGLIECPVAGTPFVARDGKLLGFAGGEADDLARARPLLDDLCRRVDHFGPVGAGSAVKLAVNLPLLVYFEALGEALALVCDVAADPAKIIAVLEETPGGANAMKYLAATISEAMASGHEPVGMMPLGAVRKDLHLMMEAARRSGFAMPVTGAALQSYEDAVAEGWEARPFWALSLYRRGKAADGAVGADRQA